MSDDAFRFKRPFSPDEETELQVQTWQTPDLSQALHPKDGRTNALNKTAPQARQEQNEQAEELVVKPLTAEDIEQIRQAAYEEGHAEGKDDGFSKGYAEGREQGSRDGLAQGQAEGKKLGLAQGEQELTEKLAQLTELIEQMQKPLSRVDIQVQQQLLTLSLAMAQAVIATEVKTNPQVILQAISDATTVLPMDAGQIRIRLNPADLDIVNTFYNSEQLAQREWKLLADAAVEQGGCVVDTLRSSVDRSLTQRVQASLEHFLHLQPQAGSDAEVNERLDGEHDGNE